MKHEGKHEPTIRHSWLLHFPYMTSMCRLLSQWDIDVCGEWLVGEEVVGWVGEEVSG